MESFSRLYLELEAASNDPERELALREYLLASGTKSADSDEIKSGLALLLGARPKRLCSSRELKEIAAKATGLPEWLVSDSCNYVGNVAEAVALLLPEAKFAQSLTLSYWLQDYMAALVLAKEQCAAKIIEWWNRINTPAERIILNRLILGTMRVSVSRTLLGRTVAAHFGIDAVAAAQQIAALGARCGGGAAELSFGDGVLDGDGPINVVLKPLPFHGIERRKLAQMAGEDLSDIDLLWMFAGVRVQVLLHHERLAIWSEGGEFVDDLFPELARALAPFAEMGTLAGGTALEGTGTVLEGTIIPARNDEILPQIFLERRLRSTKPDRATIKRYPVALYLHDALRIDCIDLRDQPWVDRYVELVSWLERGEYKAEGQLGVLRVAEVFRWSDIQGAGNINEQMRCIGASAILAKSRTFGYGNYGTSWYLLERDEIRIRAIAMYVERTVSSRAELVYTITFGLWADDRLVPFTKCRFVPVPRESAMAFEDALREATQERFGPVRSLAPGLVFLIAASGIDPSVRGRAGFTLRGSRIVRWCHDSRVGEAGSLTDLLALLPGGPTS